MPEPTFEERVKAISDLIDAHGRMIAAKVAVALSETDDDIEQLYESEMESVREYWRQIYAPELFMKKMEEAVYVAFCDETLKIFEMIGGEVGHA